MDLYMEGMISVCVFFLIVTIDNNLDLTEYHAFAIVRLEGVVGPVF